jgi:C4-dicarboxylate-specific signal transduction histidine kinase
VRLNHYVAARLPVVRVDPILIEQVMVNLLKNAAESIDIADRPLARRSVELRVLPKTSRGTTPSSSRCRTPARAWRPK